MTWNALQLDFGGFVMRAGGQVHGEGAPPAAQIHPFG